MSRTEARRISTLTCLQLKLARVSWRQQPPASSLPNRLVPSNLFASLSLPPRLTSRIVCLLLCCDVSCVTSNPHSLVFSHNRCGVCEGQTVRISLTSKMSHAPKPSCCRTPHTKAGFMNIPKVYLRTFEQLRDTPVGYQHVWMLRFASPFNQGECVQWPLNII